MRLWRHWKIIGACCAATALLLTVSVAPARASGNANTAGPPTLTHKVQPTYTGGNITACPKGTITFINTSDTGPGYQSASYSDGRTTFDVKVDPNRIFLNFTTNSSSFTVYVKGGPAYDAYNYQGGAHPAYPADTGLHSPYDSGGNLPTISHYLACGQPAKASPTLVTNPSPGGTVGMVVLNDTGTVTGGDQPGGSITFNLYDPSHSDCSGAPAYTQTVPVSGDGSYTTSNTVPASQSGTWSWTASYSGDANNNTAASGCGQETVSVTKAQPVPQGSCQGSGSNSVLVSGHDVTSYVPRGSWGTSTTGIEVVNVEGNSVTNTLVPTGSDIINSCASNSDTGQTVCTANDTDVYILKGTTLDPSVSPNPLTDSGSGDIHFSGGSATTTGVSMDATDNKALIMLSLGGVGGFQFLDLATDTFEPPFTTQNPNGEISEDPLIDPVHHLIASASEDNNFELADVSSSTSPSFYENDFSGVSGGFGGELDSTSEDCSTGILLAPAEFSSPSQVAIADISNSGKPPQAVFTPGTPGSWTAPEQVQTLTGSDLSAGASGSSVAQGTHTGVISGEFGGNALTAMALPTTSGSGATPAISDWVSCATGPDPAGNTFSMGFDPHTLVAYQSPNGGHAIALIVNQNATEMVKVDLTDMLNPAIVPATGHVCDNGTLPPSTETFITAVVPISFTADSPPGSATTGTPYSYTFAATGSPAPTFAVTSGSLPDGLTLDATSGLLSGTPTTPGTFSFAVTATNGVAPDVTTPTLTIVVAQANVAPALTADSPPGSATTGTPYSYTFAATGNPPPTFAVTSGSLPAGLSLDGVSGLLSGTPITPGTFSFAVTAANGITPDAVSPTLTIVVGGTAIGPTASDDAYTMTSGSELDVPAPGVLANDTPPSPGVALTALIQNDNALGTVILRPDGSFSYVPPPGFTGTDSFTYEARDSFGDVSGLATVSITVNSGGPPTPTLATITPAADTTVTGPTAITATLTPPAGQTITGWTVSYHRPEGPTLIQLATGTGPNVSATFDPTLVRDGTYALDIKATASGGGVLQTESGLIVEGAYKPGRYATTVQDMTVNAANIPINIQRTYDSTDKTQEDFGVGWSIGLADFRIDTNGPLGAGGWTSTPCGLLGAQNCFSSTIPHVVTVTWPDGHVEKFDMTPAPSSAFLFGNVTTAAFTAEPGSTSTLQAVDNSIIFDGTGNFQEGTILGGTTGIYDPLQFVLTAKDGTQYTIDRHLGLLSQTDTNGNTITIDASGIHSSAGPSVTFNRDAQNRITQIVAPTGTINYAYSSSGDLTSASYPNGTSQTYAYDASHDLLSIAGGGRVLRTLTYDASGRITAVTDGNGNTTNISTNVAGHQQAFADATGQLTTVETFDDRGDLIQQDQAFGGHTVTTKATYDALGHQLTTTDPLGHTTSQTYDSAGDVLTQTDANGKTTTYTYNALGEPLTITDPTGAVTAYTYDSAGNRLTATDPDGHTTARTYDSAGHMLTATNPNGQVTTFTYDNHGQLASSTDPAGHTSTQVVDPNTGIVTSTTDPTGATTHFGYDADGNLTAITDANGHTRSATYDAFDRVTSLTDATGATDHYTYDGAGNLISVTDRNGATIGYTYDADSRLISKIVPGAGTTTFTYDPLGRMVKAANNTAQLTFTYDDAGNLITASSTGTATSLQPSATFSYSYDPAGLRTAMTGPGGTTAYSYDTDQRLVSLTDPSGGAFALGYSPAGRLTSMTRPNGLNDAIGYDQAGELTSLHSTLGSTLVNQADYVYTSAGLRSSMTTTTGTTSYTYDPAGQLTSANYPASSGLAPDNYSYDPVGNRTSAAGSPLGSFTYDSADRLLSDTTNTYTYDKEGDLLKRTAKASGATTTYTWAADHKLTGITFPDGSKATYSYDPLGRLVEIGEGATVTRYAYDHQNLASEYDGTNTLTASYVYNPTSVDEPLEMTRGGQRYFYLTDAQHSTTALTTLTGATAATYSYTAFGAPTETGSVSNPITYTGQLYDAKAGLLLFPLRAYDPALGRFLSVDPDSAASPYTYVDNSPPNLVDPSGAQEMTEEGIHQHHIVARTARLAAKAREILQACKIGINDPRNLIGLAGSFHAGLHTVVYYAFINLLLSEALEAGGCVAVLGTLSYLGGGT